MDVGLLDEDLSGLEAEVFDLLFGYRLTASHVPLVSGRVCMFIAT